MLTIAIVALEAWHAAPLERAWREQGHRVVVVTSDPDGFPGADVRRTLLGRVVAPAGRLGAASVALPAFTRRARRLLEPERPDIVVTFPGTALELIGLAPTTLLLADGGRSEAVAEHPDAQARRRAPFASRCDQELRGTVVVVPTAHLASPSAWHLTAPAVIVPGLPEPTAVAPTAPDGPLRLMTVGAPGWDQGTDRLDVVARLAGTEYITVVDTGGEVDDDLAPGLRFVGEQDRDGRAEVLRHSHAYVHLARTTSGAAAGLEALAGGVPVLATESSVLADFCAAGAGAVVPDFASREDYEDALGRIRREWNSMSARARELARERPWSVVADEVLALAKGGARVA
ncbi:glycosyltransferase [Rathayibacter tanaceti]|uniref:Glycosyl transferases group 1 n=2 Tax=Rathayibacter tanaceti TaxID=1671680 RepID=A0A162FXU3_9MICO|nr:glycosyltransferase [Rathayibacter tanaceti]KZX21130.1 Glycosyl transferases group 1 [Rathayibacter tanaceti]QHC55855.1 glycosyltransferase [Rathayibacter tanaceti]TCO39319.1 glycosyltransferase involved in cell wall biosynthesis [Rathayibacter tanaceti]